MRVLAILLSLGLAATVSAQAQAQACKSTNGTAFTPGESWQEGACQKCNCMDVAGKSEKVCYSTAVCTVKGPTCGPDSKFVIKKEINPCCPVCVPLKEICGECAPGEPANPLTAKYRGTCSKPILSSNSGQAGASTEDNQTLVIVLIGAAGALVLLIMGAGMALMVIYYLYRTKKRDMEAGRSQKAAQQGVSIADSTMSLGAVAPGGVLMGQTYDGLMGVTNPNLPPNQSPASMRSDSRDYPESQVSIQQTVTDLDMADEKKKNINENVQIEMSQRSTGSPSTSTRDVSVEIVPGARSEKSSTTQRKTSARTPSPSQDMPGQSISRTSSGAISRDRKDSASLAPTQSQTKPSSAPPRSPRSTERSSATSRDAAGRNSVSSRDSIRKSRTDSASTNPESGTRTVSSRPSSTRERMEREKGLQRTGSGASMGGPGADKGDYADHDDRASLLANGSAKTGKRTTKV